MCAVAAVLCAGVKYGIDIYTHHGEEIRVPDIRHKAFADAEHILNGLGLKIEVSDTGYVRTLPPDCVLEQSVAPGETVKYGRVIYTVINSPSTPTLTVPDIIDNCSYREARAKLMAMGFKVGNPHYVAGERDWVYGIKVRGKSISTGQKVSIEDVLIIQVGDGMRDEHDSVVFTDPIYEDDGFEITDGTESPDEPVTGDQPAGSGDKDEFEVVTRPE